MIKKTSELPILLFGEQQSLDTWLENNHATSSGIRLHIAKKNSGAVTVTYDIALESALCYGWIDSQKEAFDELTWLQRFTPRKAKSIWSKVNKDKAEQLIANGRMKPFGFKAIEVAKQNGLWDKAYEPQSTAAIPEDFAETLDRQNKYAIIFRIHNAKKQETRTKRIQQFILMLEKGEKIYP